MAAPTDSLEKTRSISNPDDQPSPPHSDDSPSSPSSQEEKYARLESLLCQTLALAGEISETKTPLKPIRPYTAGGTHTHLPGECIILRKTCSAAVSEPTGNGVSRGAFDVRRHSSTNYPHHIGRHGRAIKLSLTPPTMLGRQTDNDREDESSDSVESSSIQEPFSPGSLAMSLDAVVENNRSRDELVCLESFDNQTSSPVTGTSTSLPVSPPPPSRATISPPPPPPATTPGSQGRAASPPGRANSRPPPASHQATGTEDCHSGSPLRWHVRIVPVALGSSSNTPALVKLEAVFPYRFFLGRDRDGKTTAAAAATAGWSSEGSYIIIGRPPVGLPDSRDAGVDAELMEDSRDPLPREDYEHHFQVAHDRSLQDFIDQWECADSSPVEDAEEGRLPRESD